MAVAQGQVIKRRGRDGKIRGLGVAAGRIIWEGTLVYVDAGGDATDVRTANFAGIARDTVDNSGGVDGAETVEFWTDGTFELPSSGLAAADVGSAIYASDNYTTTKSSSSTTQIGTIVEVLGATVGEFEINGLGS